ncbi:MAG: pyruvate formate lyase-activating protein [Clostridiales bacterium]|nr:pyruvate formate lyase-activating protein [Clostridiales bacterium]
MIQGRINSIETLGTLDGPGVRFVAFLQGCKLRCKYCHNPETWNIKGESKIITSSELVNKIEKYKNYFGDKGGVTFSGGEPLLQPEFLLSCLKLCKEKNIHTCIDTAGVGFGDYDEILKYTDLVILDIKAVNEDEYTELTGQPMTFFREFLSQAIKANKKFWLRQVIVPTINDDKKHIDLLKSFASNIPNVEKIELLPYKTIGVHKYRTLNLPYRLEGIPELSQEKLDELNRYLNN